MTADTLTRFQTLAAAWTRVPKTGQDASEVLFAQDLLLDITYQDKQDQRTQRRIQVMGMISGQDGTPTFYAQCHLRNDLRFFHLNRCLNLEAATGTPEHMNHVLSMAATRRISLNKALSHPHTLTRFAQTPDPHQETQVDNVIAWHLARPRAQRHTITLLDTHPPVLHPTMADLRFASKTETTSAHARIAWKHTVKKATEAVSHLLMNKGAPHGHALLIPDRSSDRLTLVLLSETGDTLQSLTAQACADRSCTPS